MIYLVIALRAEAQPIIQHYKMQQLQQHTDFAIYASGDMKLIISGCGKVKAAAATAYLHALDTHADASWLNLGTAGHADQQVGALMLANKVTDLASNRSWFPRQLFSHKLACLALNTVDRVENNYANNCLYDMEAAGFIEITSGFATLEFIQVLKVISDNIQQPSQQLKAKDLSSLMAANLTAINTFIDMMKKFRGQLPSSQPEIAEFLNRWHFTSTQSKQLSSLALQWQGIEKTPLDHQEYSELKQSKKVLAAIKIQLQATAQEKLLNR